MNWREKDLRFSIRKLKVAVASVVVGLSLLGLNQTSDGLTVVQADQQVSSPSVSDSAQAETVRVDYIYVNYNDLTAEQRQLLRRTDEEFSQVRAEKDISYVLVYRPEPQQAQMSQPLQQVKIGHLPKTGDKDGALVSLLTMSGIVGLIVLVRKQHKKTALTVLVVTGMGTGLLASDVSQALETGLKHFLIETHQVMVGEQLPQPSYRIGGLDFTYYIPQSELEGQSLNKPSDQLDHGQPTVPGQTGEQGQVANPTQPSQPSSEQTGTAEQPATPPQPLQPTEPGQTELTTELQEIDFATEIIDDANLSLGQEVVAQEGRKGQKRLTFDGDQLVSEEILEQPINRVILRGTKPLEAQEETRLEALPFTTEYQDDPTLAQGEEQVVREGQEGLRQDRYVNGQVVASEVLREPVNRLVKRGTKVDQPAPVESTVYENVAFETIVEPDPSLPLGQEVVVQEGQTGRKESKYLDGQLVSSVILDAPVAQIIRRGTKVEGQEPVETVTYDEVAFESIVEEDPSLPVGEEVLVQAGQVGRKENKFLDGQLVSSQVVQEPVNQIIRKGTRVIEGTVEVSREVELPFDTKVVADDSQYTDYQVTTTGQNGKAIVIDTYRTVNGVQVGLPISSRQETLVAPVDQVLTVGTKQIVDQTTVETLIEVQPDLETKYDDSQYADYKVTTPGQAGQIKRTETYVTVKGEKAGLPLDSKDEVISPATPTVVTIGTKPLEGTVDLSRLVALAFGTDTVTDENQYEDFTETIPGTPGQQEIIETFKTLKGEKIGEPIATAEGAVTAPVNAKIVTGTKPIVGSVEETREEEIAFTTETQYDDTKYTDYISETPGQLGAKILTEAFQTIKGEKVGQPTIKEERVTKEPVNHVIVIGTKPIEDTVLETRTEAYTVEPETHYAEEEYEDYSVEIEGTPGTKEISERFQTIKGEKVGLPILVGETILVPATPKVFLIGSKAIEGQVTETRKEVIEPETVIVYDDTKYEDYREEIAGTPGEKAVTETFRTLKGDKTEIILESSEKVLAEPIAKQIILGRMALAGVESTERIMEVAYVTRLVEDPDQYFGYRKEEGGTPGQTKVYETYQTIKGVRTGEPTLDREEVLTAPVDLVVTVGVKPIVATEEDRQVIALPFNTTTVKDETKYTDYREVTTTGQDGQLERVTTYRTVRGQRVGEPISVVDETLNEPVDEVITIGTKEIEGEITLPPRTEERDFAVEEIKDPDRYTDYYHEEGGVKGEVQITETFKTIKGQIEGNPIKSEERVITAPVKKVITVGTKPLNGQTQVVREEAIPFDTEVKYDKDQYEDYAVETGGTPGKAEITETYNTFKGEAIGQPTASERVVKEEPVNNIRTVGTKPIYGEKEVTRTEPVDFTTREVKDPDQYTDYRKEEGGVAGVKTITEVFKTEKGELTTELLRSSEAVTTAPIEKVITVGTKPIYGEETKVRTEPIAFKTREVTDPEQYTDYRKEEGGVAGVKTITEVFKTEKGELTTELLRSSEAVTTAPIEKVITVGTKPIYGEETKVRTEPIPVTEEIQLDPNKLASSPDEVLREGTEGIRTITKTYKTEKGVIVGDPIAESSAITTPMETRLIKRGTRILEAEKQEPRAVVQTVALTAEPIAEQSIQPGLENVRSYTWKENAKPSTTESSDSVSGTVIVTYTDGSMDEVEVTIKVESQADKQAPAAKADKQVVGLNSTPSAEASIDTTGLTNVRSYDWLGSAPETTASNLNATGTVRVTYTDGSYDDVPVSIIVQSEADKQAPAAKPDQQVLGLNQTPVPSASIATEGLTNVASYTWVGEAPSTAASNANVPATVRVTYTDGSYDDVPVSIKVVSEADKQAPTAKADKQVVGLNSTPSAEASIATEGLTNVASYTWVGEAPSTAASNANVPATVRVTYTDGSYDDVPVSIKVVAEADKQAPTAKEPKQVVGLNSTPSAEASIETSGLTNVRSYDWVGSAPTTTASNSNATGTVRVTYTDGSYDDVPVSIIVQSEADKQAPTAKEPKQVVGLNSTLSAEASIDTTGLTNVRSYDWLGSAPTTTASNPNATGTVRVTYTDGSYDDVPVSIIVQSEADKQVPTAKEPKQVVGLNSTPSAEASIDTTGLTNVRSYDWVGSAPTTTASNSNATGTVRVTYTDGSYDDVPVSIIVQSEADKQAPTAKEPKQVVGLNSTLSAEASIDTTGLTNVRSYDWLGSAPTTTASNPNATGTVRVTYTDGSYDDVPVSIIVQSEADKQVPTAKEPKQVVGLNSTPSAEASIETTGLTNVRSYDWLSSAPATTASNQNATGTVRVTYTDGSYDDVPVSIIVQSEADKQNPTAKAEKQVVGLNVIPDPEASINTTSLERVRSYTWKPGATPVTTDSNPAATGTVLVTYEDGSVDEVSVEVIVRSEADKQNPTAKAEKQVVGLNVTPDPEASINTTGLERVRSYEWLGSAPTTTASNQNATGTVRVTYTDGSYDDVPVSIIVQSEADQQTPSAKADKQVVGLNSTPSAEASIDTAGLTNVRSYTWKPDATPVTTASNPAVTGTVLVTYEDGSVDEVAVDVVVQSDADRQTPKPVVQKVNLKDTPKPEQSIEAGLPTGTSYTWKDGVTPVTTASTMASGQGVAGTVIVTYPDGSKDEVQVTVQVESDADRGNPTPATVKQSVKVDQQPVAADSINKEGLAKAATYEWKTAPDTSAAVTDLDAIVVVTYEDGSKDEVPVKIDVLPNKTKPTLVLEKLTELDDDKKINLNYELTDPTNAKTSITYEIYNGTEKVKEGIVDSNNPFDVDGLDWHIPYTLKTTITYDLGQGPVVETLEDVPFELEYKRIEIRHVDAAELYHKQSDGSYSRVDKLSTAPSDFDHYYVKVVDDKQKDIYLAVTKVEDSMVGDRATFKFTALAPQLIEHNATKTDNVENYTFHVPKVVPSEPGKPRTFADLVAAMTASPTARIELTEDLDASNFALATAATSYIPGTFTGQLIGNNYSITGLTAPLFENLGSNAVVDGVRLTNVNINKTSQNIFGSLAKRATGSRITNVAVQGTINGERTLGGIVGAASNTTFENVAFDGAITTVHQWQEDYTGGIVGDLAGTSLINKAKVNINLKATPNQNPGFKGFGAIVGRAQHTGSLTEGNVRNIEATGSVTNTWPASAGMQPTPRMGGLIGFANTNVRLRNAVSSVKVERGSALIGVAVNAANLDETVTLVEGTSVVKVNAADTTTEVKSTKSPEEAKAQADSFAITISNEVSRPNINKYDVDFSTVAGYNPANDLKYANTEKLLPFYNKEFIVKQGNLLTTGRLASEKVVSVVPMVDNKTVSDYVGQKDAINKLLIHYADGTVEELTLSFKETFKDTGIQEYRVNGGEVLFTPNQMTNRNQEIVDAVRATLQGLDYYDANILTKLKKTLSNGETAKDAMDKLYLRESFNDVKAKLPEFLSGILATSNVVTTSNQELAKFITDNKEELMIGLAYVNRWYNINFGDFNAKDLILNNQDFYGKPVDTLNFLVNLAKGGYNDMRAHNNVATYAKHFAPLTGKATLFDYLGDLRQKFTKFATDAEWFNATTKAHIVETKSVHLPEVDLSAYNRMVRLTDHQNGILPLLTAQEGVYILSNLSTMIYGMFDRYFDTSVKSTDPATFDREVARVKAMANEAGKEIGVYFDTWYRLNPNNKQNILPRTVPVWDAYSNSKGTYLKRWGDVDTNQAIQDFFGPILPDITANSRDHNRGYHMRITNGSSGVAYGDYSTHMLTFNLLEKRGLSIFTHENIHNMDADFYLGGYDRRLGLLKEFYPLGLLQAPEGGLASNPIFSFNTMFDFTATADAPNRYVNASPSRFQTQKDLQDYMKGSFDVLYLLDYAEATAVLGQSNENKKKFWAKLEDRYEANSNIPNAFAINTIRSLTDDEMAQLTDINSLIDGNIIARREHIGTGATRTFTRDGYFRLGLFSPIYSAHSNPDGSPGDLMFRRMSFELLAAKGYDQGFLPYASNQLADQAAAANRYGTDTFWFNRRLPFPTDDMVFKHIFAGSEHTDWADFKKDMFQERIAKKDKIKPITVTYHNRTETIDSFARLQTLMNEAVSYDAVTVNAHDIRVSRVHALKAAIYNAYLRQSKDFVESIFTD